MALPQDVTEAYLAGSSSEIREFWRTVEKRAPKEMQSRVSEFTSSITKGKCYFRDADGALLWETPDPPPPVKQDVQRSAVALDAKTQQRIDITRKLALSNADAVVNLAEMITKLHERLEAIEVQAEGMQKRVDQERRGIAFRGHWQVSIDYEKGSIVTYKRCAYVASRTIKSGGETPLRNGSGWLHMFDETEVPHE